MGSEVYLGEMDVRRLAEIRDALDALSEMLDKQKKISTLLAEMQMMISCNTICMMGNQPWSFTIADFQRVLSEIKKL